MLLDTYINRPELPPPPGEADMRRSPIDVQELLDLHPEAIFLGHEYGDHADNAGYDTPDFHKTKEAYASAFDEYFKASRHRLGAHVQDFDFGKRIELWNDIEIIKISFFVDGAQEIYRGLAP